MKRTTNIQDKYKISVEKANPENVFSSIRDEWQQLSAASDVSPFLSWEWQSTWHELFGSDGEPFILKTYRDKKLIGILPLRLQEKRLFGMRLKRLGFIGEETGGADYLDLIARPEDRQSVLTSNLTFLQKDARLDLLCLDNMASSSQTAKFLRSFGVTGGHVRYRESSSSVCPKIDLSAGWPIVLKQSKRSSNFKRRLKQIEKMPQFEFRSVTATDETAAAFERFLLLHEKRWSIDGGSELSGHPRLIAFQRDVVGAMVDTGLLRFDELWVEGECRASVYGFDDANTFYYYNAGYDPDWAKFSVGLVLIGLSIRNAVERGNRVYDFLRGEETYKFDWANQTEELVSATLAQNKFSVTAYLAVDRLNESVRDISRSVLPASVAETLKKWRRKAMRNYRLPDMEVENA